MKLRQKIAIKYIRAKLNMIALVSKEDAAKKAFELFCTPQRRSKRKPHGIFDKAEKLSFQLNDLCIKGYRFNHPSEKKALIVHGFESSAKNFYKYIQPLIDLGFEVLAFDGPAHGRSEGKQIQIPLYIQTLEKIESLYGPLDLMIGHSFGGLAIALFLEKHPESSIKKSVLIAPATETSSSIKGFYTLLDIKEEIQVIIEKMIVEKSGVPSSWFSISRAAPSIQSQILWIHDKEDDLTPYKDALVVKNKNYSNFQFITTQGLGHRKIYKNEEVIEQIMTFVKS